MVEAEKGEKGFNLASIISRYIRLLSADPTFSDKTEAQIRKEALKRASGAYQNKPDRVTDKRKESISSNAEEWGKKTLSVERARQDEATQEAQEEIYGKLPLKQAKERLKQVRLVTQKEIPDWLKLDEKTATPEMFEFASRLTSLPEDLQNNPHVLYREAAKFYWSMDWHGATNDAVRHVRGMLDRSLAHVAEIAGGTMLEGVTEPALFKGIDRRFDLYRTSRLHNVSEAATEPKDKKSPAHEEWRIRKILEDQHGALDNLLLTYQKQLDLPENSLPRRQEELLKNLANRMISGQTEGRKDRELGNKTDLNREEVEPYLRQIQEHRNVAEGAKDVYEQEKRARAQERPRTIEKSEWVYNRNPDGSIVLPDHPELQALLGEINQLGGTPREDELFDAYERLNGLVIATDGRITPEDVEPYRRRIEETYIIMHGERFQLTPDIISKLRDPKTRDEVFFDRMKSLLDEPDRSSRDVLNLYKEAELDAFIYAVGNLPDGDRLVKHFANLKQTIIAFHDLDFYARSAAGDVKSFKIASHYFQNAYAVEAMSDPLVETMLQSYEQALKMIRDNNDGYIPPSLVSYSPKTTENYWDELTRRIFEEKVKAGLIYDYKRDESGFGKLDMEGRAFMAGDKFTEADLESQKLRVLATMRMAKGMGILDNRLLEIFAFSKTPGYLSREYGTSGSGPVFSSKAYEGIARWFNPMGDWFGKYKMGDNMFAPYFATLIGVDRSSLHEFMFWDQRQWEKVVDMAAEGTLHDWLTKKYGSEAGRLLDLVTEFAFSGRFGPLSGWGEHDVTLNFTDLEREREGGAMRLFKAKEWAGIRLEKEFGPKWDDMKNTEQGQKLIKTYARGYQGWIWVQTTLRSPTIVASEVRDPSNTYELRGEKMPRRLRNVVIEEVLNEGGKYKIEDKVKSEATPTPEKKALMARIELLERDVMLVQQAALYGNNGRPRNIEARDFEAIKGTGKVIVNRVVTQEVAQATRRKQAEEYVERVKNSVLGEWHEQQWREKLGIPIDVDEAHDKDDMLIINNLGKSKEILEEAQGKGALLSIELVDKKQPVHMGLEDVQWRYLDLETLGERSWARRGSDLEARATTIEAMIKHLDSLRPHPNLEEIGKSLEEIYNSEKMHDPNEAHKFVYLMSRGTGEMYRQVVWGKVPILGRIVSKIQPSSIAQQIYGVEYGTAWSANNLREFVSVVQQSAKLPYREVDPAGNRHAYNIKKLEKEFGATRFWAFLEMGLIGSALVTLLTAGLAVKESLEDEKKH